MNPFYCSWEWHLGACDSRFAPLLYSRGCRLSSKSEAFYPSAPSIANHFCKDRTTVFKALQELVRMGWAEVLQREPGKPVVYRFVDHEEWARNHPDLCTEKDVMPWEGEGDPLGREMYAVSGGRAKFLPYQMIGLRKSGFSDQQIVSEFRTFLDRNPQTGSAWKRVYYKFHPHILRLARTFPRPLVRRIPVVTCRVDATRTHRVDATPTRSVSTAPPSLRSDWYPSRGRDPSI
jgi:hypothetical protein